MLTTIRDNVTRTTHYRSRCDVQGCRGEVTHQRTTPAGAVLSRLCDAHHATVEAERQSYVDRLMTDRARLASDLAGPCRDPEWRADRIEALAWTNKELCRLGAVPAGWDSVDTSVDA